MSATAQVPPQNIEAEESVIGACLVNQPACEAVLAEIRLSPEDFYLEKHATIFRCIGDLYNRSKPVDELSVSEALVQCNQIDEAGGKHYVSELAAKVPVVANATHYAEIVQQNSLLRRLLAASQAITESAYNPEGGAAEGLILQASKRLEEIAPATQTQWLSLAADLLSKPDPGPTPFLVEGLIVEGAIAALVGPYKRGKTWTLLDMGVCISSGQDMFGKLKVKQGPVMIVLEESGVAALHRRLAMLARGRGIDPAKLSDLHYAANARVRLDDPAWQARLISAAKEIKPAFIGLDPLVRMKGSADENSQAEMAPVLDFIRDLRDASGGAVLFSHHTGHGEKGRMRGTSDFEGYWESKITITAEEGSNVADLRAEHREADSTDTLTFRRSFDEETESLRLELVESTTPDLAEELLSAIRFKPGRGTTELAKVVGKRRSGVASQLSELEKAGTARRAPSQITDAAGRTQTFEGWFPAVESDLRPVPDSGMARDAADVDGASRPSVPALKGRTRDAASSGTDLAEAA